MRASRAWSTCLLASFIACGGRNTQTRSTDAGGAADSADLGAPGLAQPRAGSAHDLPSGPTAAAGGAGGDGTRELGGREGGEAGEGVSPPKPESGARFCEVPVECSGLECRTRGSHIEHVCVTPCRAGDECRAEEMCVQTHDLEPSCLARCDWPTDCAYRFDCFDWYKDGQYVCVPAPWLQTAP
jgi:hypothetical protein